ncbi:DUF4345 family protein [Mycobacterium sp. 3519A]|uniref:DUF4345 family protein n=1 Tax=Mycobacterium sp. 3519A TaxID=2057184 RepID=UPI00135A4322
MTRCCGARDVARNRALINLVAAAFFIGGIGRLIALAVDGPRHPFYGGRGQAGRRAETRCRRGRYARYATASR